MRRGQVGREEGRLGEKRVGWERRGQKVISVMRQMTRVGYLIQGVGYLIQGVGCRLYETRDDGQGRSGKREWQGVGRGVPVVESNS